MFKATRFLHDNLSDGDYEDYEIGLKLYVQEGDFIMYGI